MKIIKLTILILCLSTTRGLQSSDVTKIDFVKSYIENEGRPTHLVCCNLCWKKMHKISVNHFVIFTPRGFYNGTLVDTRSDRGLFHRRNNMMGHKMSMSVVVSDSNSTMYHIPREDRLDTKNDAIAKVSWMSAKLAFEMLNATPEYTFSFRYGYKLNGTWSGMIADLIDDKVDTGTNIFFFSERLDVVDFTDTVAPITLAFMLRQPPLSYEANIYSLPFSSNVWTALIGSAALFIYLVWLSARWETKYGTDPTQIATMGDSMLLTAAAISQQGCNLEPRKASGRIMLWIYFTALTALYAAFSANVVVLLQSPSNSIRTLEQLVKSKITIGAIETDYSHFVFKLFDDPVRVEIRRRIETVDSKGKPHFYSLEDGIERVRKGLFALFSVSDPMYYQISNTFTELEKCDLMLIEFYKGFPQYIPVKKNSPYLELMRITIKRLREAGINKLLKSRIYPMKPSCSNKATAFTSVGMQDFKPALIFLLYGNLVAVSIALVEIIVAKMYVYSKLYKLAIRAL